MLAIPGVIITTLLVGYMVSISTGLALPAALVFGALIAASDPVAVVALFRRLGAPKRLQVMLEGESLFNDGTAIVVFGLMLEIAIKGGEFSLAPSVTEFIRVAGGGVVVGIILGLVVSKIINNVNDPLIVTTLTTILAFGSFLVAEHGLHVSGVLAVVAAGIVNGNIGPRGMSPTTRMVVFNFWEYTAFLANSFIFLLIGLTINVQLLIENWQAILWAILAVLVARAVSVYIFSLFTKDLPWKWRHILFWGGLRGAISLALVLSIPNIPVLESDRLKAMAFGVVLFTLLVQGTTMGSLSKVLKLVTRSHAKEEYERRHARFIAARSAYDYLRRMSQQGLISDHTWQRLSQILEKQNEVLIESVKDILTSDPTVEAEELDTTRREALRAQRSALTDLMRDGVISEEIYSQLVGEVDIGLNQPSLTWPALLRSDGDPKSNIKILMAVVIQKQDLENAIASLTNLSFTVTRLSGTGGFLRRKNITLLIGMQAGREDIAVKALKNSCKRRLEFISSPVPGVQASMPTPSQVTVGGATIFTFEVEFYDEF